MKSYTLAQIDRWRNRTHRRLPRLRIATKRQALRFVDEVGFCFVFNAGEADFACLGESLGEISNGSMNSSTHNRPSSQWQIRTILPDETEVFQGKMLLRRPMLLSLEFLPYFIALNDHVHEGTRSRPGRHPFSPTAQLILESLQRRSPQSTQELRRRVTMSNGVGEGAFNLALTQLQTTIQIASLAHPRSPSSGLWAPVCKHYGKQIRRARRISVEEARRAILERHFRNQLVLTVADIRRLFRWERQEIFQTLGELIRRGIVTPEVQVEGIDDRTYCLLS